VLVVKLTKYYYHHLKSIQMIEEKVIPESNLEVIKKRIKFLEAVDPNDVTLKLLKLQISINVSEEDKI